MNTNDKLKSPRSLAVAKTNPLPAAGAQEVTRREFVRSAVAVAAGVAVSAGLVGASARAGAAESSMGKTSSKKTLIEPSREIPILDEADVVVCGGGPAGVGAAISAARNGAKTILLEHGYCLGGTATSGLMNRLGPYHDQEKIILGGIPWEILQRLIAMNAAASPVPCLQTDPDKYWVPFDPEAMKYVLDRMVEEAGVKVLFHSYSVGLVPGNGRRSGVILESKCGRRAILAKVVVDATGDGDMAVAAGASFDKGRAGDRLMQPMSIMFKVGEVEGDEARQYLAGHKEQLVRDVAAQGESVPRYIGAGTDNLLHKDEIYFNIDHVFGLDGTKVEDLSRAAMEARKQIWQSMAFAKKHIPGYEKSHLSVTAARLGVRETRRIVGDYILTIDDVLGAKKFDDAISRYACWVDIHTVVPGEKASLYANKIPAPGTSYDIPYRCLLPAKVDNLLVAGRCFSATHEAFASARMMPSCMAMGQAAGTAAALAANQNVSPRNLNVQSLQNVVRQQGAMI
jgi:glycine/D-amino acid oxidase-like deaminating enzyme